MAKKTQPSDLLRLVQDAIKPSGKLKKRIATATEREKRHSDRRAKTKRIDRIAKQLTTGKRVHKMLVEGFLRDEAQRLSTEGKNAREIARKLFYHEKKRRKLFGCSLPAEPDPADQIRKNLYRANGPRARAGRPKKPRQPTSSSVQTAH
jgi:hypothetical protein